MNKVNADLAKVNYDLLPEYYVAVKESLECDDRYMKELKEYDPYSISFFQRVGACRKKIRKNIDALKSFGLPLYFGTLTFNTDKDSNLIKTKRRESFLFLNSLFLYFMLVEEYGEDNGRYHIHFVGMYREGKGFEDFRKWHSRQNIEPVQNIEGVCRYMIKYVSKQLPRVRRNKNLVCYEKLHSKLVKVRQSWCYNGVDNKYEKELVNFLKSVV